jgi:dephospho-CoA kinase
MPAPKPHGGVRIGLTGGMASGKTTVAETWRSLGAHVLSSDATVHRLLDEDDDVKREIAESFGSRVFDGEGRIVRSALGAVVFTDESARQRLMQILHPRTLAIHRAEADAYLRANPGGVVVYDSPLLFESGLDAYADLTVVVSSPHNAQVARALARAEAYGQRLSRDDVERRIALQMPMAEKCRRATYVIENDGTLADLERTARELWRIVVGNAPSPT